MFRPSPIFACRREPLLDAARIDSIMTATPRRRVGDHESTTAVSCSRGILKMPHEVGGSDSARIPSQRERGQYIYTSRLYCCASRVISTRPRKLVIQVDFTFRLSPPDRRIYPTMERGRAAVIRGWDVRYCFRLPRIYPDLRFEDEERANNGPHGDECAATDYRCAFAVALPSKTHISGVISITFNIDHALQAFSDNQSGSFDYPTYSLPSSTSFALEA
ncbi:hypothetical protein C8Q80DRAFT_799166 [Daedaleopsis nitida]|nr:hypothetical protein C8Q80DRAFT_799166 [Daedaleopsis nitida]